MRSPAEAFEPFLRRTKRDPIDGHLFNIDLQKRREGQIPERRGDHDQIGLRKLVCIPEARMIAPVFFQQCLALVKIAVLEVGKIFCHQIQPRHGAVGRQCGQKRLGQLSGVGRLAADTAIDKQNVFHCVRSCSRR